MSQSVICAISISRLTSAALLWPGLFQNFAHAAEDDNVDFKYSHYQEGKRDGINLVITPPSTGIAAKYAHPNRRDPIEVDSLHGSARISLIERIKFAFNYIQISGRVPRLMAARPNNPAQTAIQEPGLSIKIMVSPYWLVPRLLQIRRQ